MSATTEALICQTGPAETAFLTPDIHEFDFISRYADYADILEAPREMHEIVAMQLIATILNRNGVTIPLGSVTIPMDLWVLLLSGSGFGRSTLVGLPRPLLEKANLTGIIRDDTWGSAQGLFQDLSENPSGLFIWGEMSEKLKTLSDRRFENAKEWLTDRYNNMVPPAALRYRKGGNPQTNTQPIEFAHAPRINILATSSVDWFFANLAQEDSTGGFIPRWMIVTSGKSDKVVPIPRKPDPLLAEPLVSYLNKIATSVHGEVDLSEIQTDYERWYGDTKRRFESQPNQQLAIPYFNRHRIHALQLAVLFEVSITGSLRVSMRAWKRAVEVCNRLEKTIYSLLPTGMNAEGYSITKVENAIRETGDDGMYKSDFTTAFQHDDAPVRERRLKTLVDGGKIHRFRGPISKGRPPIKLVHSDYVDRYVAKHPGDRPLTGF
jgi:hypothetical protein